MNDKAMTLYQLDEDRLGDQMMMFGKHDATSKGSK